MNRIGKMTLIVTAIACIVGCGKSSEKKQDKEMPKAEATTLPDTALNADTLAAKPEPVTQRDWSGKYEYTTYDDCMTFVIKKGDPYTVTYESGGLGDGAAKGKGEVTNISETSIELTLTRVRYYSWDCMADAYKCSKEKTLSPSKENIYTIVEEGGKLYCENNGHRYKLKKK